MNLGDPGALKALQPTPLVLCPRTEMLQKFVLISVLCNVVPCASLGMCVSGNLHKFLHHFFFFPTNLPGSGVRSYGDDIPVTPHIDHIENMCLFILGLLSPVSAVSQHLCFPGVWPVTEGYRITVVKSSDFCILCLGSNPDSSTFCLCGSEQSVFPFCKNECAVDSNNCM